MKGRITAVLLALSLVFGSTAVSAAVKEEKTVPDAAGSIQSTGSDGLLYRNEGTEKMLLDQDGKEYPDLVFRSSKHLVDDVWELDRQGAEVPESCVVRTDGTVLVPWGMIVIDVENEYYLQIVTGKEQTDNKDEAMMYVSPNMFTIGFPGDEDVLYKGTKQLFDLKGGKMLEDYVFTDNRQSFEVVGSTYIANDRENNSRILDASGNVLEKDASRFYNMDNYYYQHQDGKLLVYDDTLKLVTQNADADGLLQGGYLSVRGDDDKYGVMSMDGTMMIEPVSEYSVRPQEGGLFEISQKNDSGDTVYGLVDKTGKTILEPKYYMISEMSRGYLYAKETSDSETTVFLAPDGRIIDDQVERYPDSYLCVEAKEDEYLILNTGKTLSLSDKTQVSPIGDALISVYDPETRLYGAYELFDGTQLLDSEWEKIQTAYGKIYALKDGEWHVFSY